MARKVTVKAQQNDSSPFERSILGPRPIVTAAADDIVSGSCDHRLGFQDAPDRTDGMSVARPQLRGLLKNSLKRNFIIASAVSVVCTVAWRLGIGDARKARYAEFYKSYDPQKDFERMKSAGVFTSVMPDGSVGQGWS